MNIKRTHAIVLRRTNYSEADRIIQFLTPNGKLSAIVKGARREKSRLAGGVELFAICDIVVSEGRGELSILTSARLVKFYKNIVLDYDRMQFAYLSIKLVSSASEMVDNSEWYDLLFDVLDGLGDLQMPLELVQSWFYLRYSSLTGYELSLQFDINGVKLIFDEKYKYNSEERGLEQDTNGSITSEHIKLLRLMAVKSLKLLTQISGIKTVISECLLVSKEHASINE
jgi:DNA repair protein RecO (recombination protein O)